MGANRINHFLYLSNFHKKFKVNDAAKTVIVWRYERILIINLIWGYKKIYHSFCRWKRSGSWIRMVTKVKTIIKCILFDSGFVDADYFVEW